MSKQLSERLNFLKDQLFNSFFERKIWWGDDLSIFDSGEEGLEKLPMTMRKALAFEKVCNEMPIQILDRELIVGTTTMSSVGFGHTFPKYETDEEAEEFAKVTLDRKSVWGHHLPYYPKVLTLGYLGIIEQIDKELAAIDPADEEGVNFLKSSRYCLQAACKVPARYADLAEQKAVQEENEDRKAELLEIARICRKVPMNPPETFHEALQAAWFVHMLLHSTLSYTPLGRIDQYLYPCYEADVKAGTMTRERALDLIGSFWIKFNERMQFKKEYMENHLTFGDWSQGGDSNEPTTTFDMENDADYTFGQSANHWLQSATVSGLGPDGVDKTNDLSYLLLRSINDLELISPMISARIHKDSPKEWIDFIGGELCEGGAQPVIFNDDVIATGMIERMGIPKEDAWDYSSDGCWEVLIYGKTEYAYGHIELLPCMEALFNRGKSMNNSNMIGFDIGEDGLSKLDTFDKFYEAYFDQVRYRIDGALRNKMRYYDEVHKIAPEPFLSAMVCDCVEKHRDMTHRGARYRFYSLMATGLSHCIDSLSAIKKVVYDEKRVTLEEAIQILRDNWEGHEALRQYCLNRTPKYGNDDPEADAILTRFFSDFCDRADYWNQEIDELQVTAGVATFENYPRFGQHCWASFDGRVAHEAVSSNYSPAVGRDREGITAAVVSATKPDLSRLNNGCPVDLRVSFNKSSREESAQLLSSFIRSFRDLGGNTMTITKVDIETLKKAQQEPEKYLSLRVRLGGLTVYFVQLAKEQQDEYMRRTEHNM